MSPFIKPGRAMQGKNKLSAERRSSLSRMLKNKAARPGLARLPAAA
jgi:hypothetical protein